MVTVDPELIKKQRAAQQAAAQATATGGMGGAAPEPVSPSKSAAAAARTADSEADLLSKLPQFVHLGPRFSSSKKVALSESGTEYEVACTKHVYANHLLLQFSLNNTLEDQLLEGVSVSLDLSGMSGLEVDAELKCDALPYGQPGDAFLSLKRTAGVPVGTMAATLKFLVKDVEPGQPPAEDETGYDDEYNLEELELVAYACPTPSHPSILAIPPPPSTLAITPLHALPPPPSTLALTSFFPSSLSGRSADFVKKQAVVDFKEAWSTIGADCEVVETFSLSYNSLKQAMDAVLA